MVKRREQTEDSRDSGWKPVTLEGVLLSNDIEGLIAIEELTDYNLERSSKKGDVLITEMKSAKKKKSALKRKHTNKTEDDPDKVPAKKIKKVKTKNARKVSEKTIKATTNSDGKNECNNINSNATAIKIDITAWSSMGVPDVVIKALADQKFFSPTPIQALTLPAAILGQRDILGAAETGSGKTLAFGIPIIKGILDLKSKHSKTELCERSLKNDSQDEICSSESEDDISTGSNSENEDFVKSENCMKVVNNAKFDDCQSVSTKPLYALIITPTRELAVQIKNHLTQAAKYTDINIAVVLGGMATVKQERILSKGPEIVIATPGRLWELIQEGNPHLNQIDSIKYLAIDETDRMMEKGHFQELHSILEKINSNSTKLKNRQTFVFSATLTMVHDLPDYLEKKRKKYTRSRIHKLTPEQKLQQIMHLLRIKKPKIVDLTRVTGTAGNLTECRISCTIDHKDYYLYYFLKKHSGRTLVFCNSIGCVKRLATLFAILECKPLPLHANMHQKQRLKNLERFQAEENGLLIATDVAARGLDIPNIEHVIHYQVPRTSENYVHRSGRTARAEKEGITVLMMEPSEKHYYSKLCTTLRRTHDLPTFPVIDKLLIAIKERVDVAREIDKLELKCRRKNTQKNWLRKAAEDMDIVVEDDVDSDSSIESDEAALRRQLKAKKHQLQSLLSKPIFPKGFSGRYPDVNIDMDVVENGEKAIEVMKRVITDNSVKNKSKPKDDVTFKRKQQKWRKSKKFKKE